MIDNLYLNIGAMKAGTTWLYSHLSHHPDIHFSREKEIHYFTHVDTYRSPLGDSQRLNNLKANINALSIENDSWDTMKSKFDWYSHYFFGSIDDTWYENLFANRRSERYCADFSNLYAHLDEVGWNHIKLIARNLRVTYIMRHPMRRLWSHIKFHTKLMGQYEQMLSWDAHEFENLVCKAFIWDNAEYSRVVETIMENLKPEQYKIMFFEDIHEEPANALREIEAFLGVGRHQFNEEKLTQKINVSNSLPLPKNFVEQFRERLDMETERLIALGLTLPNSWDDSPKMTET